jgi:hypothetical protein
MSKNSVSMKIISIFFIWMLVCTVLIGIVNVVENVDASGFRMDSFLSDSHASFLGEDGGDRSGIKVAMAGDVNGDGYDDILIGADSDEESGDTAGKAYLIFGKVTGWNMDVNLSNADASFLGEDQGDFAGWSLACAGDVNSDGFDDILIGAWRDEEFDTNAGQTYLILGKSSGWSRDVNLSNSDASFLGELNGAYSGYSVDGCGDVNGDGYDDILIGARYDDEGGFEFGQVYVIFGKSSGWAMDTSLSSADASYWGEDSSDFAGWSVAGAGDVNGDGLDDILIGATGDEEGGGNNAGQTYLILGKTSGWAMDVSLSQADASFIGEDVGDWSGNSIDGAGDVNGDGYDDILIGANLDEEAGANAGQTYLILGKSSGWVMDVSLSNADASFLGEDAGDSSGFSVAICGDVNSDGYDDILIGAPGDEDGGAGAGQSYLILGKQTGWTMDTSLSNSDASFWGEDSMDNAGWSVAGGGDVNSDGYDDILIGAYFDEEGSSNGAGQTYLVFYESAPSVPKNIEASLSRDGSHINITWKESEFWKKITGYIIYRSEDGLNYNEVAVLSDNTLSYMDSNVILGREYIYTLIATSSGPFESKMSDPISIFCDFDSDLDKVGNMVDLDDDGDGVSDGADAFPLDPTENFDFDNDGIGDNTDTDDDNDLIPDSMDIYPYNPFNNIEITMDDLLLNLSSLNATLSDEIQDLLMSITADVIGMNASLSDELTPLLNDMTTDSKALRTWLELVLTEMDSNLTATNNSLAYLAKWEDVLTKLDALDQALQDGNQQLQTSIDDVSADKAEDEGIGLIEVLLVVVLVVLCIDLLVTLTGRRGGRAGRLETQSNKQVGNVNSVEGGSEIEEVAKAQRSAPSTIRTRNRAVSSRDYEEHALGEPEITRARADSEYGGREEITTDETERKAKENEAEE